MWRARRGLVGAVLSLAAVLPASVLAAAGAVAAQEGTSGPSLSLTSPSAPPSSTPPATGSPAPSETATATATATGTPTGTPSAASPTRSASPTPTATTTPPSTTPTATATPAPRAVTATPVRSAIVLRSYPIRGSVTGAVPGTVVRLWWWNGTQYVYVQRVPVSSDGSYSMTYSSSLAPLTRTYRVNATWPDGTIVRSAAWRAVVHARADVRLSTVTAAQLPYTYRSGCPVGPTDLRRMTVNHRGFDGYFHRGQLIAARWATAELSTVLDGMARRSFPLHRVRPVDVYSGSDVRSMASDNTSAFNCRKVTGNPYRWSRHSWGDAVDINPFENPYVTADRVYPVGSEGYLVRSPYRIGMIRSGGYVATAFADLGWPWGARWSHPDYQHFSRSGG
jgi:hypothetical protein